MSSIIFCFYGDSQTTYNTVESNEPKYINVHDISREGIESLAKHSKEVMVAMRLSLYATRKQIGQLGV